ncbi:hypothetical protein PR048_000290 [Dryococelus australis]|uniref:Uncharacterized protein n=1 Tax=Dryococelus australis TaxID=614101 RepID=A0ABQ9IET9_9NEOP|nr:hypothetical protein PR048_000290 [Dryococelus australis]
MFINLILRLKSLFTIRIKPTSRGAVGWCATELRCGRLWVRIQGKARDASRVAVTRPGENAVTCEVYQCTKREGRKHFAGRPATCNDSLEKRGGGGGGEKVATEQFFKQASRFTPDQLARDPVLGFLQVRYWIEFVQGVAYKLRTIGKKGSQTTRVPPRRSGFDSRWGRTLIFACGKHPGRCRWSTGFLTELPFLLPFHSGAAPYSPRLTFIRSQDLAFKSRPNFFSHSLLLFKDIPSASTLERRHHDMPRSVRDKEVETSDREVQGVQECFDVLPPLSASQSRATSNVTYLFTLLRTTYTYTPDAMTRGDLHDFGIGVPHTPGLQRSGHYEILRDHEGPSRGGVVDRLLASRQGEPGSILSGVRPDIRMRESRRTMPLVGGGFLGVSGFPALVLRRCFVHNLVSPSSALKT